MSLDETIYSEFNTSSEFHEVYTKTTSRIRRILFPEIVTGDEETEAEYSKASIVSRFAVPTQQLKEAVLDLLNVRAQPQLAPEVVVTNNIPQFVQKLSATHDQHEVLQAAKMVHQLSKEEKIVVSLASSEPLVDALIRALNTASDEETRRHVAAALSHLSANQLGAAYIFRSGGIAELVRLLRCPIASVINYATTTLHHLLVYVEQSKQEAIACGALEAFVPLLAPQTVIPQSGPNPKLQAMVADSLYFLLLDQPQCKNTFLSLQGPRYLVEILRTESNYIKLLYAVVRCIRSISTHDENKAMLIAIGGIELLHRALKLMDDDKRKLATLNALRNLSDAATNLETLNNLVNDLIILVAQQDDDELVGCACGILSNLTCNNILNKKAVCTAGGISCLARALAKFCNIEDVTEPALCTLRHCTVRHPLAHQAQNELRFAHPIMLALLATGRPPIVKASLGLLRNCSLSNENLRLILNEKTPDGANVLTLSIEFLEETGRELAKDWLGLRDGVSLLEMVEGAISALHQFARDPTSSALILHRPVVMNLLVDLISNPDVNSTNDELLMREIMGLIYQLTKSRDGAKTVIAYEAQPHIVAALQSPHKSIAAYASIILKNMGIDQQSFLMSRNGNYNGTTNSNGFSVRSTNNLHQQQNSATNSLERNRSRQQMGWLNDGMEPELYNELYNYPPSLGELRQDHIEGNQHNGSWFDTDL
uniref:Armadillo segment polarity protein n=1 Tax=Meloidogyne incognita TaxID=6306 RepID=A0A914KT87_MELIC